MRFGDVYPLYVQKVEKKDRTKKELNDVIEWLTGYNSDEILLIANDDFTFEEFFNNAPKLNPERKLIKGLICGIRVEEIKEPLMQEIRYLDKIVDELAKGKNIDSIKRSV